MTESRVAQRDRVIEARNNLRTFDSGVHERLGINTMKFPGAIQQHESVLVAEDEFSVVALLNLAEFSVDIHSRPEKSI